MAKNNDDEILKDENINSQEETTNEKDVEEEIVQEVIDNEEISEETSKENSLQIELDNTKIMLLRTAAEYENFRKRSTKEKETSFNNGVSHATTKLIAILDTLDFAINAPTTDEEYKKGVVMISDKANEVFLELGIQEIEAMGKEFNPETMSAVSQAPIQEGQKEGEVVMVFQKGYTLHGKVIRHASVVVAG